MVNHQINQCHKSKCLDVTQSQLIIKVLADKFKMESLIGVNKVKEKVKDKKIFKTQPGVVPLICNPNCLGGRDWGGIEV
jgi:hypothetical protein